MSTANDFLQKLQSATVKSTVQQKQKSRPNETNSCEIKCVAFSRMIYRDAHWNMKRSYRLTGKSFLEQNLVSFPISDAIPIENGKMLDEAVSPTVAHVGQKPAHRKTIPVRQ